MDRITAETEQIITDQLNTDRDVGPQGADKARGSRVGWEPDWGPEPRLSP